MSDGDKWPTDNMVVKPRHQGGEVGEHVALRSGVSQEDGAARAKVLGGCGPEGETRPDRYEEQIV